MSAQLIMGLTSTSIQAELGPAQPGRQIRCKLQILGSAAEFRLHEPLNSMNSASSGGYFILPSALNARSNLLRGGTSFAAAVSLGVFRWMLRLPI